MSQYSGAEADYHELTLDFLRSAIREVAASGAEIRGRLALWAPAAIGERLVALSLLLLLLPLLLCAGLAIVLLSRRTPLVAHARVGYRGKKFWVLKLRTMWGGAPGDKPAGSLFIERLEGVVVPDVKNAGDPRVTSAFAAFCRKHSVDELPQLWHVVCGEMSFVGPRPMTVEELSRYYGSAAQEILRLKPGLTGLWQVSGRSRLNYQQRLRLDLLMVRNWSFRLYLGLLLATIPKVLKGSDAW